MAKSKKASLTDSDKTYVSEKEVKVKGKKAWLVKTGNHIKVTRGEKVVYDGPAGGWHRFLRIGKTQNEK